MFKTRASICLQVISTNLIFTGNFLQLKIYSDAHFDT